MTFKRWKPLTGTRIDLCTIPRIPSVHGYMKQITMVISGTLHVSAVGLPPRVVKTWRGLGVPSRSFFRGSRLLLSPNGSSNHDGRFYGAGLPRSPSRARSQVVVAALFEKFTERSIKSVMLAQQLARDMSSSEVRLEDFDSGTLQGDACKKHAGAGQGHMHWHTRPGLSGSFSALMPGNPALQQVGTDHLILGLIAEASNKPSAGSLATHVQVRWAGVTTVWSAQSYGIRRGRHHARQHTSRPPARPKRVPRPPHCSWRMPRPR